MGCMTGKSPKRPRDPNQLAKLIVDIAAGDEVEAINEESAAAKAGRLGGAKGGTVRAASLTPEQRQESARKAAAARWSQSQT